MKVNYKRYIEKGINKIGFLDIETHGYGFNVNESFVVCWVLEIFDVKTKKSVQYYDVIDKKTLKYWNSKMKKSTKLSELQPYDTEILKSLVSHMKKCHLIVGHYSNYFDIPFVRSRCAMLKIPFITHSDKIRFADTWVLAKFSNKFKRNGLDNVGESLGIGVKKTRFNLFAWRMGGVFGDKKYLDMILDHNFKDVTITKRIWNKLESSKPIPIRYY